MASIYSPLPYNLFSKKTLEVKFSGLQKFKMFIAGVNHNSLVELSLPTQCVSFATIAAKLG